MARSVCAAVHAGDGRREAASAQPGGRLRPRRRLSAERASLLVVVLPRVHVPSPARVAGLRRARSRLSRQRRLRPRLADRDLSLDGRQGSRGRRRRREVSGRRAEGRPAPHRRLRRQLRRVHHADGDVHDAGRRSRRAPRCVRSPTGRTTTIPTRPTSSTSRRPTSRRIGRARRSTSPKASRARC